LSKASKANYRAVALMGATGTGKSALALELAETLQTSIISCDSMQLYRGLDIGTAKASLQERQRASHFLIDCADVHDIWSAQRWADAALAVIEQENRQGRVPLIVGGTGMYLRALTEGFADIPAMKEGVREHFIHMQQELGTPYLHAILQDCDAVLASRLHATDTQRIIRGLCVYESSGVPLSEWQARHAAQHTSVDCPVFVLDVPRPELRERLASRIHAMIQEGWLEEVQWLDAQDVDELHPALRAVGYRQLLAHVHGECSLERAVEQAITATRKYAKRQVTWFKHQTPDAVIGDASRLKQEITTRLKTWI